FHSVSLLDGIRAQAGGDVEILYSPGLPTLPETVSSSVFYTAPGSSERGLKVESFNNPRLKGEPVETGVDTIVNIANGYHIATENRGLPYDHCSMRWSGVIRPEKTADYRFVVRGFDGFRLKVGGEQVINEWRDQGITLREVVLPLKAGEEYPVELEYFANVHPVDISFGWREDRQLFDEAAELAAKADIAIVSIGFNESLERESNDRPFELPEYQDSLVNRVLDANPNTAVLVNAGSNSDMSKWQGRTPALLYLWYPGQEGGTAAAEILFGKVNPSGKLPVTFEKRWEDNPAYPYYYDNDGDKRVTYGEGLLVGYRHYDTNNVTPNFPFGFGKSYTTFSFSGLKVKNESKKGEPRYRVSFDVTNTGDRDGKEVAQVYIRPVNAKVFRPLKELKGYDKKMIKAGETARFDIELDREAFSYYKTDLHDFGYDPGEYEILVGNSSADILLRKTVRIK
ncbi:MAG: glycoside hydrolase family 3 C-terminal domain-containing protein, partial [Muribaculaceae bacterium]|nr:glycoside hydrolase family 3 C-terminal domain-containing protein [Muribaculaceae bacterium]